MVSYLKSLKKHASDIPYIVFKLYNNIVVPSSVYLDACSKSGVVEANFRLSKKVLMISASSPNSFCWNECNNIFPCLRYPVRNHPY
jgi:hypothetical protein